MTDLLTLDSQARRTALEPRSFIVEAPAGAGKTELLTQRTLRLLALVDHPEEVLALTFTNKAATEMRDRILGSLALAARGERPGPDQAHRQLTFDLGRAALARDGERGWQLLAHPGRLAVTTLDALCGSLARQMPLLSRFGAQPGVAEDAASHYAEAARRTLELLEEGGPTAETVATALRYVDNNPARLEKLIIAMLARREQWQQHTARSGEAGLREEAAAGVATLVQSALAAVAAALPGRVQGLLMGPARFAAATLAVDDPGHAFAGLESWDRPLGAGLEDLATWQALAALLLTSSGSLRKTVTKNQGFPTTAKGEKAAFLAALGEVDGRAEAALAALGSLPPPALNDAEWTTVLAFSHLLNLAAAQLWLVFQEAGEVDFSEIAQRALLALGDDSAPTDLALALDYRIRHLLVDEFQDTSPAQVRLIAGLTRGWQADDGRSLFLVGDPMQSIYRFRKADVGLFLKVRDFGIGDIHPERLALYRNNRSCPAVVDWVNDAFPGIFPGADQPLSGAVRYTPAIATRADEAGARVDLHPVLVGDEDAAAQEAQVVLNLIRQARAENPAGSIAILVRARSHLDALVAAFRRQAPDLPFQGVDTEALSGRQAIADLLSLAQALHHRADRVHWLAVLRAPWCGLTLADLHALAGDAPLATLWQLMQEAPRLARLSPDGQQRLSRVRAIFQEAFVHQGRMPARRWLEAVWQQLGGPATLQERGDADAVAALFARIDALSAQGRYTPETLVADSRNLFAPPNPDPAALGIQMMTIHKSKGLEFDTVILPGLHRTGSHDDPPLLRWDEIPDADGQGDRLVVAPINAGPRSASKGDGPSIYDALGQLENERAAQELRRLLYVGVTRARRCLHLVGIAPLKDGAPQAPRKGSLLALLWPVGAQAVFAEAAAQHTLSPPAAPGVAWNDFIPPLLRLPTAALPAYLPNPGAPSTAPNPALEDEGNATPEANVVTPDTAVGTLVHRCLELIANEGLAAWPPARIAPLAPGYQRWLLAQGLSPVDAEAGARRTVAALEGMLADAKGRWLLDAHPEARCELPLCRLDPDNEVQPSVSLHIIDRSFVADGERWIVDYKTFHLADPSPAQLRQKAESYRPQLERYASLFARLHADNPLPIRTALYFVEQKAFLEIRLDTPPAAQHCTPT